MGQPSMGQGMMNRGQDMGQQPMGQQPMGQQPMGQPNMTPSNDGENNNSDEENVDEELKNSTDTDDSIILNKIETLNDTDSESDIEDKNVKKHNLTKEEIHTINKQLEGIDN